MSVPSGAMHLRLSRAVLGMVAARQAGDPAAVEQAARAEELLRRAPRQLRDRHPDVTALVSAGRAAAELAAGHLDAAEQRLRTAVATCGRTGTEEPLCDALGCLALVELLHGRLREAESRAASVLAETRTYAGCRSATALAHLVLAAVATEHDELEEARARLDAANATACDPLEPMVAVQAAAIGAGIAAATGGGGEALRLLRNAEASLPLSALPDWEIDELAVAESSAHMSNGDAEAALTVLGTAPGGRPEHAVAEARAMLALGNREGVPTLLAHLADNGDATAAVLVRVRLLQARIAAAADDRREANRRLRDARGSRSRRNCAASSVTSAARGSMNCWVTTRTWPSPTPGCRKAL
ncbi:hypothetical protein ACU686_09495 [Yinghuangia aomiensis]